MQLDRQLQQLENQCTLEKQGVQQWDKRLQRLNDLVHENGMQHETRMNEIFLQHQKNVAEQGLGDHMLTSAQEEQDFADEQQHSKLELAFETMLQDHFDCIGQLLIRNEKEIDTEELAVCTERAATKKEYTVAVKQLAMEGQDQLSQNESNVVEYERECTDRCEHLVYELQQMAALEREELLEADMSQLEVTLEVECERKAVEHEVHRIAEQRVIGKFENTVIELESNWEAESAQKEEAAAAQQRNQCEQHLAKVCGMLRLNELLSYVASG